MSDFARISNALDTVANLGASERAAATRTGSHGEAVTLFCEMHNRPASLVIALLKCANSTPAVRVAGVLSAYAAFFGRQSLSAEGLTITAAAAGNSGYDAFVSSGGTAAFTIDGTDARPVIAPQPPPENVSAGAAAAMLTIAIYAVVKEPGDQNITAFTANRPRALKSRAKIGDRFMTGADALTAEEIKAIHIAFVAMPAAKRAIISAAYHMSRKPVGFAAELIASQFYLLEGYGLAGYYMAIKFVTSNQGVLAELPMLQSDIAELRRFAELRTRETGVVRDMGKAMYGDLYRTVRMRAIPNLAYIATIAERKLSSTAANLVAPLVGNEFRTKAEAYVDAHY